MKKKKQNQPQTYINYKHATKNIHIITYSKQPICENKIMFLCNTPETNKIDNKISQKLVFQVHKLKKKMNKWSNSQRQICKLTTTTTKTT